MDFRRRENSFVTSRVRLCVCVMRFYPKFKSLKWFCSSEPGRGASGPFAYSKHHWRKVGWLNANRNDKYVCGFSTHMCLNTQAHHSSSMGDIYIYGSYGNSVLRCLEDVWKRFWRKRNPKAACCISQSVHKHRFIMHHICDFHMIYLT